ncbi:MAG: hypothetical protein QOF02_3404 [Blastocatellia bacterium]|jgi:hypothetical protein|nr:hypothetical protein [Blastocatellia bacterium]
MNKLKITIQGLTICLLLVAASSFAQAQATRTWVSGVGDDLNPCSRTAPCKTFAGAIAKTAVCGEISVLDPGGFGAVTITKSITINGEGTIAGITASLTNGIIVNAGAADNIYLKNIDINGVCNGINGIRFIAGNALIVEKVRIYNFTNFGIDINKTSGGFVSVNTSNVSNCVQGGIVSTTTAGTVRTDVYNSKVFGCTNGYKAGTNSQMTVKDSVASGCGTAGFLADTATGVMNMDACVATHNGNGVRASNAGTVRLGASTVSNNITKGLDKAIGVGVIESYSDNYVRGNPATDAPTAVAKT